MLTDSDEQLDTQQQQQHTFAPLQLKGEIMDLEFTMDTDHRCGLLYYCLNRKTEAVLWAQKTPTQQDHPVLSQLSHLQAQGAFPLFYFFHDASC
jgi:hypothetical protein